MGTWVVIGASRGIGLELCRRLHGRGERVIGTCRDRSAALDGVGCEVLAGVDVADDGVGDVLERGLPPGVGIDVLVCNAGVLRRDRLDTLGVDGVREQLEVNTLGPLRVVLALLPRLHEGSKLALVSSKAGSIGDRPSGGTYGYRASKTALNMLGANLAHDLAPRGIHVVLLHPGFVRTEMTSGGGNVEPADAAAGLVARIDELDAGRSGRFFHADGQELPW